MQLAEDWAKRLSTSWGTAALCSFCGAATAWAEGGECSVLLPAGSGTAAAAAAADGNSSAGLAADALGADNNASGCDAAKPRQPGSSLTAESISRFGQKSGSACSSVTELGAETERHAEALICCGADSAADTVCEWVIAAVASSGEWEASAARLLPKQGCCGAGPAGKNSESVSDGVCDHSEVGVDGGRPCLPLGPAGTNAVVEAFPLKQTFISMLLVSDKSKLIEQWTMLFPGYALICMIDAAHRQQPCIVKGICALQMVAYCWNGGSQKALWTSKTWTSNGSSQHCSFDEPSASIPLSLHGLFQSTTTYPCLVGSLWLDLGLQMPHTCICHQGTVMSYKNQEPWCAMNSPVQTLQAACLKLELHVKKKKKLLHALTCGRRHPTPRRVSRLAFVSLDAGSL